ncbi:MAG: tRNA preQ1(34) S-adenosylmethionine ribosyltransferase-isomerase QueA [Patescibacteria group bacterium]
MRTSDFDYHLPKSFIAQNPVSPRDSSKLLVYDSSSDRIYHRKFSDIGEFLKAGDVLVLNRSKVIPARIIFEINGFNKEIFLLKKLSKDSYEVLVRPGRSFKQGAKFFIDKQLSAEVKSVFDDGRRILKFSLKNHGHACGHARGGLGGMLDKKLFSLGRMPLPPYITDSSADFDRYQTVYAKEEGSKAAPTAGLHFTKRLLKSLKKEGIGIEEVILHVGLGTFAPVVTENVENHTMHFEEFELSKSVANHLNSANKHGGRIIAVGTTSVRVLESCCHPSVGLKPKIGETNIFIYPGKYKWKIVDALITNFHLPKSTLIMLASSFLENKGIKNPVKKLLSLYETAKKEKYRFYSFGDAMFIF